MPRFKHENFVFASTVVSLCLASIGLSVSILAAVGYTSGRARLYTWFSTTPMAFPTMVALIVISCAVIINSIIIAVAITEMSRGDIRYQRRNLKA